MLPEGVRRRRRSQVKSRRERRRAAQRRKRRRREGGGKGKGGKGASGGGVKRWALEEVAEMLLYRAMEAPMGMVGVVMRRLVGRGGEGVVCSRFLELPGWGSATGSREGSFAAVRLVQRDWKLVKSDDL